MVKRYILNAASIAELYDVLPGEVVNVTDYDAIAAELADCKSKGDVLLATDKLDELSDAFAAKNARIAELEAALREIAVGRITDDIAGLSGTNHIDTITALRLCKIAREALGTQSETEHEGNER